MRRYYNKDQSHRNSDLSITHMGYLTGNGAYYYYNPEPNKTYQDTMIDLVNQFRALKVPIRFLQYDSWWYPKDNTSRRGGVIEWTALDSVFPDGLAFLHNVTQMPVVAHNRWWSYITVYEKHFDFIIDHENSKAIPQDAAFWDYLMKKSALWGLITYEQVFIRNLYSGV